MKKLFSVLAIVALVSCNSNEGKTEEVKPADTTATTAPAAADTAAKMAPADSTGVAK